jgi:hypothetical protein
MDPTAVGIGFKPAHLEEALSATRPGLWFEVHPENHMAEGGPRLRVLDSLAARHPISLHGVSMSLAGPQPPDPDHLRRFASLVRRVHPAQVSEHLAWSRLGARYEPDLLPFVRNTQSLQRVARHVQIVQDAIGQALAIENPAHYLSIAGHTWDELDFLRELVRRTDCRLLIDVANVHLSAHNLGFSAEEWLDRVPADAVAQVHLAGHSEDPQLGAALWIDSHDTEVDEPTWTLYRRLVSRIGPRPTIIEKDGRLPSFERLMEEVDLARRILTMTEVMA